MTAPLASVTFEQLAIIMMVELTVQSVNIGLELFIHLGYKDRINLYKELINDYLNLTLDCNS